MTFVRTIAPTLAFLAIMPLAGCTVGPDFVAPLPEAPDDWSSWHSGDRGLIGMAGMEATMPARWWTLLGDPVLDRLVAQALAASPDLDTAALHYAQARVQQDGTASAGMPQLNAEAQVTRNRQSEYGASTRLFDALGNDRETLAKFLAQPFTLYRGGFDAAWEPDLWGRIRRMNEQAGAQVSRQQALLDLARLSVAGEVAQAYFDFRTTQRQIALTQEDIRLLDERVQLVGARAEAGLEDHSGLERENATLNALRAGLPALRARETVQVNRIAVLVGRRPGELDVDLRGQAPATGELPDLSLGMPSQVSLNRPDVRAAVARLHAATAAVGVATADLYPAIRLGGGFNLESYRNENLFDWGSRSWSIGPSLSLPLFDGGRRRSVIALRRLEEREAAVAFQQTMLRAWQEIDDALSGYTADRQQQDRLMAREGNAARALALVEARYRAGAINYLPVIDARRAHLQAQRELADTEGRMRGRFVAINKAIGNVPPADPLN